MSSPTQPRWIISFADLLSVVLAFLVLSYSMSLPPAKKTNTAKVDKDNSFSVNKSDDISHVATTSESDDLSTNYLYQLTQKKIKNDAELATKLKLQTMGDSLMISVNANNYIELSPKLTRLLGGIKNDIWIYSANLETSKRAYEELQNKGFDKNVTYVERPMAEQRIDIVIYP